MSLAALTHLEQGLTMSQLLLMLNYRIISFAVQAHEHKVSVMKWQFILSLNTLINHNTYTNIIIAITEIYTQIYD